MPCMTRNKPLIHATHNGRIPNPQPCRAATLTDAHIAAMRAGGMSTRAIRRALGLSEAAATAAGLLEPGRLVAAPAPGGGATNAPGGGATNAPGGGATNAPGPGGPDGPGGPGMTEVLAAVSRDSGIDCKTLIAPGQRQPVVRARQLVTYLIRELCPRTSLSAIGLLLDRDHTTVLYGCHRAAALLRRDRAFREAYLRTRRALITPEDRSRG